jgi:hypothetical protein
MREGSEMSKAIKNLCKQFTVSEIGLVVVSIYDVCTRQGEK